MTKIRTGGCLCGSIRFETRAVPRNAHTCSCEICQRHSGATSLIWVEFNADDVLWTGSGGTLGAIDHEPVVALVWASFDNREDEALRPHAHSFEDVCPVWAKIPSMTTGE